MVFNKIGKNEAFAIKITFEVSPIPNHRITKGIHARGGICLIASNVPEKNLFVLPDIPINVPIKTPRIKPIPYPCITLDKLINTS